MKIARTFLQACFGWAIFRAHTLEDVWLVLSRMTIPTAGETLSTAFTTLGFLIRAAVFVGHVFGRFVDAGRFMAGMPPAVRGMLLAFFSP